MNKLGSNILITGAGFTRAFLPEAPLLVDDWELESLIELTQHLSYARGILDVERALSSAGKLNFERLLTRCLIPMPYEAGDERKIAELRVLASALKGEFVKRIQDASSHPPERLVNFARYCLRNFSAIVTFNYDTLLDHALFLASGDNAAWHPDTGYGFDMPSGGTNLGPGWRMEDRSSVLLLKLHGSINWKPRIGPDRYPIDAIAHISPWSRTPTPLDHLNRPGPPLARDPIMLPPIMSKADLVGQPVFQHLWTVAEHLLRASDAATFIGYSFPPTDLASRYFFSETMRHLTKGIEAPIHVVTLAQSDSEKEFIRSAYDAVLRPLDPWKFFYEGAVEWIDGLLEDHAQVYEHPHGHRAPDIKGLES